ncbi:pF03382 family protein [Firmicutes bacterium CAG:884]|nr:pF03382 family protein [Firmicutes bacterium CAG:884]
MVEIFAGCSSLTSLDLSSFNTSNVTDMVEIFAGCSSLTSLDLSNFNTSNVTNMQGMFSGCSSLTSLDLNSFNTLSVTDMSYMFYDCSSLISLDLSGFNALIGDLLNSRTFSSCTSLKYLDISNCYFLELDEILYALKDSTNLLTTINITNFRYSINQVFYLTSAKITINYTSVCEAKLDAYLAAHPDYNWVKGKLITAPSSN